MLGLTSRQRQVLLQTLDGRPRVFAGLFALSLMAVLLETSSVFTVLPLVAALLRTSGPALLRWCLVLAALMALRSAVLLAHARLSARASGAAIHEAKMAVLKAYGSAPEALLLETKAGRMIQILTRGAASSGVIVLRLPQLAAEVVRAGGLTLLLFWLNFRVTIGLTLTGFALWEFFSRVLAPRAYVKSRDRYAAETEQSVLMEDILRGARQLRLAAAMDFWQERFAGASRDVSRHHAEEMTLQALPKIWFDAGAAAVILGWIMVGAWRQGAQSVFSLPKLAAIIVGGGKLLPCLSAIARYRLELLGALPNAEALQDFFESCPRPAARCAGRRWDGLNADLKIEGLRFTYPGRAELLKGIDLDIPAGRRIVLAGPYGCGKTTLLGLLLGLHEPSEGRILLDGRPLGEHDHASWLGRVGVVPQDSFIFHTTVAENILMGRDCPRQDVERASRLVGIHAFIASLPQGYETVVGERGLKISGGQRQMLALARALLTDPKVLVLDEPAAGLDPAAQAQLTSALSEASRERTVIVAAHQADWAQWADAAFLLNDGLLSPLS